MRGYAACCCVLLALESAASAQPSDRNALSLAASAPGVITAVRIAASYGLVTSTWRSVAHNRAVGGVPNSHHLQGNAIDIVRRPGVTHSQLAAAFRGAGYNLIESLDEGDHSHFAFDLPVKMPLGRKAVAVAKPAPENRVAADDHGTLLIDLAATQQWKP